MQSISTENNHQEITRNYKNTKVPQQSATSISFNRYLGASLQ